LKRDGTLLDDPVEQLEIALDNISKNLKAAGMEVRDMVKLTLYLVGSMDNEKRREVLSNWLDKHQPCMTLIYVASLASPILKVEIDAMACVDEINGR